MNPFCPIKALIEYVHDMLEMRAFYNHLEEVDMKRRYKPGGPDMSACQGYDGDHCCDKREFCERYTGGPATTYVDRIEFPGIYENRCSYFIPNKSGEKKYFVKTGQWEF